MQAAQRPLLLMLGADRYAIEACVRHDIDGVVVCGPFALDDGLVELPASVTVLPVDDQRSPEAVLTALHRAGLAARQFDGVQTTDERSQVTASLLARHLGCDFMAPEVAIVFRDKSLQKDRIRAAGIRTAEVTVIDDVYDVSGISELPYPKAVLKPAAGAATVRTSVVHSIEELRARSAEYRKQRIPQRTFVLEEYIGGDEWLADGVMSDGEVVFCSLARYGAPCLTMVDNDLPVTITRFDPDRDARVFELALPTVHRALAALGLRSGVFHMELFHDPGSDELVFGECAARRGGALVHEEVQAKFNVHLSEAAVFCALGWRPDLKVKRDPRSIGGCYLVCDPGVLIRCPTPAQVAGQPGVVFARVERPYGSVIADGVASTNQRVGQFVAAAADDTELARVFERVRDWFAAHTTTIPATTTTRELRAWQRRTWPDLDFGDTLWN